MRIRAWLHNIEAVERGVNLQWITESQKTINTYYPFLAEYYIGKSDPWTKKQLASHPEIEKIEKVSKYVSIHDWTKKEVYRVSVNPVKLRQTYFDLRKHWGDCLFNADLSLYQHFCFQTGLFPYVYAEIQTKGNRLMSGWKLLEHYTDMEYHEVPFKTIWLQPMFEEQHFLKGRLLALSIRETITDKKERAVVFADSDESSLISECVEYIQKVDPDILFTKGGDTFIPVIAKHAVKAGVGHLLLGRGKREIATYVKRPVSKRGHSYMSYGRIYYSQHGVYLDGGRHHYDVGNSFMYKDGKIEGLHELVRLGCSDPQKIARGTIGTTLTAVQMRTAYYRDLLIPPRKADAERFRSALSMVADVGGLVFSPVVGFHKNVVEVDFSSMYPSIMVHRNVSPDTIDCACCQFREDNKVPLTDHHICLKRKGLVSLALENILKRREYFKSKRKEHRRYERKQKVLKWLLVTSFGYQGYRNARFGRIEAHEAISAYGRDALTKAQHLTYKYGLQVVAGIVDSLWVKHPSEHRVASGIIASLLNDIEKTTRLPIEHSADYHWIVFLPRRHEPTIGVLNRYYGLRTDGTFKVRGIELRQSSAPVIVKKFQKEALGILAKARTRDQFRRQVSRVKHLLSQYKEQLQGGNVTLDDLTITIRTSRSSEEYVNNTHQAIAAKQLAKLGVNVEPGMKVEFVILNSRAKNPAKRIKIKQKLEGTEKYDVIDYTKLLERSFEGLIPPEMNVQKIVLESYF
ncbi:MAG: DNA polymerase domain-containing protein [Candidatus Hodarchaeales archaeon]